MVTDDSAEFFYWAAGTHGLFRAPMRKGHPFIMAVTRWTGSGWMASRTAVRELMDGGIDYDEVTADEAARRFPAAFRHV